MATVYRIQNDNNYGLYSCGAVYSGYGDSDANPSPYTDIVLMGKIKDKISVSDVPSDFIRKYHFGFSSFKQLKAWVFSDEWREHIDSHGFKVYVYEIEDRDNNFFIGRTQTIFLYEKAKHVETFRLIELTDTEKRTLCKVLA